MLCARMSGSDHGWDERGDRVRQLPHVEPRLSNTSGLLARAQDIALGGYVPRLANAHRVFEEAVSLVSYTCYPPTHRTRKLLTAGQSPSGKICGSGPSHWP